MVGPGKWIDEGPMRPYVIPGYSGALVQSAEPVRLTPGEMSIRQTIRLHAEAREKGPKPPRQHEPGCHQVPHHHGKCTFPPVLCGKMMLMARQPCARRAGHIRDCATAESLKHKSERSGKFRARQAA